LQKSLGGAHFGNRIVDSRTVKVHIAHQIAFKPIQRIGGKRMEFKSTGKGRLTAA